MKHEIIFSCKMYFDNFCIIYYVPIIYNFEKLITLTFIILSTSSYFCNLLGQNLYKMYFETIFTQKMLVNFTNNYKSI